MKIAALTVRTPQGEGRVHELTDSETLIGRASTTDLRLPDESLSREHAVILFDDAGYSIEDLQSTNGTQVNGKRVRSAQLQDGDEIRVGNTSLRFSLS